MKQGLSVRSRVLSFETGSALIEVVAFAAVAFGLVLSLGLNLLQNERELLELQGIARNAMRAHLKDPTGDILQEIARYLSNTKLLSNQNLNVAMNCVPADCNQIGSLMFLELSIEDKKVQSFGVSGG